LRQGDERVSAIAASKLTNTGRIIVVIIAGE
jgi:hypothetical protein